MANILQIFLSRPSKAYLGIFVDKTKLDNFNPFTAKVGSKLAGAECQATNTTLTDRWAAAVYAYWE